MPARKKRPTPRVGSEFVKKFKGKTYKLKIIKADSRIAYELGDTAFPSPSAAAKSITQTEVNGWAFWLID
jgi:Protein of unknown function (DUF2924)